MTDGNRTRSALQEQAVQHLCRVLRSARETRGLTQAQIAESAGMTRNHYQLLEAGRSATGDLANPRLSTICALANVLELPLGDLLA